MQSVVNPISSSISDKIRYIRTIRVRFTSSEFFFEHGFYGLTRMLRSLSEYHHLTKSVITAFNPCSFHLLRVFFRTRIYRIDADASLMWRYCLPDSSSLHCYKSRDCVPGYSRSARYWLPASTPPFIKSVESDKSVFVLPPCFFSNTDLSD